MAKDSIYITGWEYNRLLGDDPTKPVQSGLPAAVLYRGSSQFWLFRKVYCTKESLESELQSAEALGWAQGKIFRDLKNDGFLHPYSWSDFKNTPGTHYPEFTETSSRLKAEFPRKRLQEFLDNGEADQLENIKLRLIGPLCDHLNCVADVTPDAIVHWKSKGKPPATPSLVSDTLGLIAAPIMKDRAEIKFDMTICQRPGSRATPQELTAQMNVVQDIELPRIPTLLLGDITMEDYLDALYPHAAVYRPISSQMLEDWENSRKRLNRLRELAEKHVWPDLHGEWLPRLEEDPAFYGEIGKLIRKATLRAKMGPLLDQSMRFAIIGAGAVVGLAANAVSGPLAGVILGALTKESLSEKHKETLKRSDKLTLFYQAVSRQKKASLL
ncbi:MAG: hypothetical protein Q7S40_24205 [Opitutaceae bacterium]|nr:hypothetical protein [Opitutaceae bacterium]